jgi:hypothetical protein
MWWRWWLIFAIGCNDLYGLDDTIPRARDRDGDGADDDVDNCIEVPNKDQANSDPDAFGDACDLCPAVASANHDEDADGKGDECDPCPMVRDFPLDEDQDGVGDGCDDNMRISPRRLFDPGSKADAPPFQAGTVMWMSDADELAPATTLASDDRGYHAPSLIFGGMYSVSPGFRATRKWTTGDRFGVMLYDATTHAPYAGCEVRCSLMRCEVELIVGTTGLTKSPVTATPRISVTLQRTPTGIECSWGRGLTMGTTIPLRPVYPGIIATPDIRVRYIEVLE